MALGAEAVFVGSGIFKTRRSGGAGARDRARHHALAGSGRGARRRRAASARRWRASRWRRSRRDGAAGERAAGDGRASSRIQGDFEAHARALARAGRASGRWCGRPPISTASTRSSCRAASRRRCSHGLARDGLEAAAPRLRSRRAGRCSAPAPARSCSRATRRRDPAQRSLRRARRRRRAQRLRHAARLLRARRRPPVAVRVRRPARASSSARRASCARAPASRCSAAWTASPSLVAPGRDLGRHLPPRADRRSARARAWLRSAASRA